MKEKIVTFLLYALLLLVFLAVGCYFLTALLLDDVVRYYCNGVMKYIFLTIVFSGIMLPVLKYRKYKAKWVLPLTLSIVLLILPVFCNGLLKFAEDDLRVYSREKWDKYEILRYYMIDDLQMHYLCTSGTEEDVVKLLGDPDPITFYVQFENGELVQTGVYNT